MTDCDEEIAPLLQQLETSIANINHSYLPALLKLNEDVVSSEYDSEAQASIYLSAAYTLALSLYAHDKLQNEAHLHHPKTDASINLLLPSGGSFCDKRLLLQLERILDTVKELRELKSRDLHGVGVQVGSKRKREKEEASEGSKHHKGEVPTAGSSGEEGVAAVPSSTTENHGEGEAHDDLGDSIMFKVVSRPELNTGKLVKKIRSRLL